MKQVPWTGILKSASWILVTLAVSLLLVFGSLVVQGLYYIWLYYPYYSLYSFYYSIRYSAQTYLPSNLVVTIVLVVFFRLSFTFVNSAVLWFQARRKSDSSKEHRFSYETKLEIRRVFSMTLLIFAMLFIFGAAFTFVTSETLFFNPISMMLLDALLGVSILGLYKLSSSWLEGNDGAVFWITKALPNREHSGIDLEYMNKAIHIMSLNLRQPNMVLDEENFSFYLSKFLLKITKRNYEKLLKQLKTLRHQLETGSDERGKLVGIIRTISHNMEQAIIKKCMPSGQRFLRRNMESLAFLFVFVLTNVHLT